MAGVTVRRSTSGDDFQFVADLVESARSRGEKWAASWSPPMVLSELSFAQAFVAVVADAPVGFLLIRPPGAAWEITLTAVSASFRKSGVFKLLLTEVLKVIGRSAQFAEIHLEVRADNSNAISAYESCGFTAVGRRRGYYSDGTDAILYKRA